MLRSLKYGLYGAVLAGVVGGTVAWTTMDKTVHLVVDGHDRTVHTTASNVGEVLRDAGFRPGPHDLLAPAAQDGVKNGATIVYKRGRLLHLSVDGTDRSVWTTAPTVALALNQLGFSSSDYISVSRSRRLPLGATDIALRTPKTVTVVHDGKRTSTTTTDATVGDLLGDLSLSLGTYDRLAPSAAQPITAGQTITITRVVHKTITSTQPIPFASRWTKDSSMLRGHSRLATAGHQGLRQISWAAVYVDGKLSSKRRVGAKVLHRPVTKVVRVGTKAPVVQRPAVTAAPSYVASSGSAQSIARSMLSSYGWSSSQFSCLDTMWTRESGWRVNAENPSSGAYGIPQALPGSKMASAGPNWQSDAATQIRWGLNYIASRYDSPCQAWALWQSQGWY